MPSFAAIRGRAAGRLGSDDVLARLRHHAGD